VIESCSVHINSDWVRQLRDCGLEFDTLVKNSNVTVVQAHGDMILEGPWMDINLAINNIKDAVAKSLCGASDTWNHANGSSSSAMDSCLDKLNPDVAVDDFVAGKHISSTTDIDCDQMTATDVHQNVSNSRHVTASASPEMHESQIEIDDYLWHYIALMYSNMQEHWEQTFRLRPSVNSQMIEITGKPQDIINFKEWFKKHDVLSVKRRVIEIPSSIDVNVLKALVDSSKAAGFRVCVRSVRTTDMECIGKASDINDFVSWLNIALHDITELREAGFGADDVDSAQGGDNVVGNVSSCVNSTITDANQATYKSSDILHADRERLMFKTAESQLVVNVLTGDLTRQKSEAIVNPANRHLLHSGGAAKAIQSAAGPLLLNECKDYIRKHKELPTSSVMHTTSGNLPRPINHVIHACGPNVRDYPDDKQCLHLLEKTFLNCFVYANDTLHVQRLALPAISSGITLVLNHMSQSQLAFMMWHC